MLQTKRKVEIILDSHCFKLHTPTYQFFALYSHIICMHLLIMIKLNFAKSVLCKILS